MNTGIYEIINRENGKRYVGSAVNMRGRFAVHRTMLVKGGHHSRRLQRSWNKRGAEAFEFRPLLWCARKDLLLYEQIAIDGLSPEYNICKIAGSCLGVRWTDEARARKSAQEQANPKFAGRKHTDESKALISAANRGMTSPTKGKPRSPAAVAATAAAHLGMKRSDETRAKIAAKATGRKRSLESIEKGAAKRRGVALAPEHAAKLIGNKHALGSKHTEEWKRANSLRHIGKKRPKDAAYRAKISAGVRAALARKKAEVANAH
jgi:group I intron endonuclease